MVHDTYSEILHEKINYDNSFSSVTPIFQTSAFDFDSEYFYARKSTPNVAELEQVFLKMEDSKFALAVNTGMTAIFMCLSLLKPNSTLLLCSKIYGCSYKLIQKHCAQYNIKLDIVDLSSTHLHGTIGNRYYDMCFFETPTNPFLDTVPILNISNLCKQKNDNCIVVVDNTWATPLFQKPLKHGADISLYSGTKYFGGHSDVMCGVLTTDKKDIYLKLFDSRFYGGFILPPFPSWLLRRSLQTFKLRIEKQSKTTKEIVAHLKKMPHIKKIYYPNIDGKQLTGYGGIIFIDVDDSIVLKYSEILKSLKLFGSGTGMACVTSMIAQPYTGSHASLTEEEKNNMNVTPNLLRICLGLEDVEDLIEELSIAFNS